MKKTLLLLLTIATGINFGFSQNTVIVDFETANSGYTAIGAYGSNYTQLFNRTNYDLPNCINESGYFWAFEDINPGTYQIIIDTINISTATEFNFSIDMVAHHYNDWDTDDEFKITYSLDGGPFQNLMWVQSIPDGDAYNSLAAIDTDFDGDGECGPNTTLPSLSTGSNSGAGCSVSQSDFATFSTPTIPLSGLNTSLVIKLEVFECSSGDEGLYFDNITITHNAGSSQTQAVDLGVIEMLELADCGDSTTTLKAVFKNHGADTINGYDATINWSGNTTGTYTSNITTILAPFESDTITFGNFNNYSGGSYNFEIYCVAVGDTFTTNDTILDTLSFFSAINHISLIGNSADTVCYGDSTKFAVSNNGVSQTIWTNSTGTGALAISDTLKLNNVTANDTFYAYAVDAVSDNVGVSSYVSGNGDWNASFASGLSFSVNSPVVIESVDVYPTGSGNVQIQIIDQSTMSVIYTGPSNYVTGTTNTTQTPILNTVTVNAILQPGDYIMSKVSSGVYYMLVENNYTGYPITSTTGALEITGGMYGTTPDQDYWWFYNWQFKQWNCESNSVMANVMVDAVALADLGSDTSYCENDNFNISLSAPTTASSYSWSTNETTTSIAVDTAGTYWLEAQHSNGCITSDTITVSENSIPSIYLGNDTSYCSNEAFSMTLNAGNNGASFLWSNNTTAQTLLVDTANTYWVSVTDANNCNNKDTIVVSENQAPIVDLGNDTTYCSNIVFNTSLDAGNTGANYLWNDNSTNQTLTIDTANTYWVSVTNANNCTELDTLVVVENPSPVVDLGTDTSYCSNEFFSLLVDAGNAGANYQWSNNATSQFITVDTADVIWVVVTNNYSCVDTDTFEVIETVVPEINLTDQEICQGESINLDAGNDFNSYNWSTSETTSSINVTSAATYSVTATTVEGCTNNAQMILTVNSLPVVNLGPDTGISLGNSITLDAGNGFDSYNWNTGETTQSIVVEYSDVPGDFYVSVTDLNGCIGGDTIYIDANVGINSEELSNLKVYPNPTNSILNIELDQHRNGNVFVNIYSLDGRVVYSNTIGANTPNSSIDLGELNNGNYILLLSDWNNQIVGKKLITLSK